MWRKKLSVLAVASAVTLSLTACGGDDSGGEDASTEITGKGPITFVTGKDTSGFVQGVLDKWNADHPDEQVRLIELPESADAQRSQMIANAQTESDEYDVLNLDVVWTAEFAANRYVIPLPEDEFPLDQMLEPVVETAKYLDKVYSIPVQSDGGLLYYRTDLLKAAGVSEPPKTWDEMKEICEKVQATPEGKNVACYAGQFEKYEGLTVNAAEAINSAGGVITDESGKPNVNTEEAAAGLDFLVQSFEDGTIPKEGITYMEEQGRRAFQEGRLLFHRQWPYQYALANGEGSKVVDKFAVAPLPGLDGPGVSSLGGHNLGISTYSKNKETALEFIKFYSNLENNRDYVVTASQAPVYTELYEDEELNKQLPFLSILGDSIANAQPRPKVVNYGDATIAIQDAAYAALTGDMSTEEALEQLQGDLEEITADQQG